MPDTAPICPLCGRPIPPEVPHSRRHLVPRLRGGKGGETVLLHEIRHKEIHASQGETEIARDYACLDAPRAHPRLARFIRWVKRFALNLNHRFRAKRPRRFYVARRFAFSLPRKKTNRFGERPPGFTSRSSGNRRGCAGRKC